MPKRRDPTLMESLQKEAVRESQLKTKVGKSLSPKKGLKRGLREKGMGRRGHPY